MKPIAMFAYSRLRANPITFRQVRGTSLVEVMVALLLLSIGLLSMAGIHATSLKLVKINQSRTAASEIAQAMGDAVRGNVDAAFGGRYTRIITGGSNVAASPTCTDAAVICTPNQIAASDMFSLRQMAAALPGGDIYSVLNAVAGSAAPSLTVWVYWAPVETDVNISKTDQVAWDSSREGCPANVAALTPRRQCISYVVPL